MSEPRAETAPGLSAEWRRACDWIERNVGRVARFEHQPRWRPAAFIDAVRDGRTLPLYFRGDRGEADHGVYPLEHEMAVLQVLEAHGIPVPHVYGFCEDPRGIVMEAKPGRANLATARDAAEREAVLDHYMELLAKMHAIDVSALEAVGLACPRTAESIGLCDFDAWERSYRRFKVRPEPLIEFAIRWVRRNVPQDRERACFITCDAGQFLFDAGRVTAVLDLELAQLGDPAADIAGMICRDLSEPLGDLARAVRKYEQFSGRSIDRRAIHYHTVRFGICTPMVTAHLVAVATPGVDHAQYLSWYLAYSRAPLEVMAHLQGIELEPIEIPPPTPTRHSPAFDSLVASLSGDPPEDEQLAYRLDSAARVASYLRRAEAIGPALEAQDLDEVESLLGTRPAGFGEADLMLEAFVEAAGPEHDEALIRYFHRRVLRQEATLAPAMRELEHARLQLV